MNIFDRNAKKMQKDRSAAALDYQTYSYLKDEVGYRLSDRIFDINKKFPLAVDLGCGYGHVSRHLNSEAVERLIMCDRSDLVLSRAQLPEDLPCTKMVVDEEVLPFDENSVDLVMSSLSLHWVNRLPDTFHQVYRCLKSDGVFIGCLFGGETLYELRGALQLAEIEREGGFAAHVSPFAQVRDVGSLLNRAGFTMLTIDTDEISVGYPSIFELMHDLKGMAENNASWIRKPHLHRDTLFAAASIYKELYSNEDGSVPATFQMIYFIGWKPDPSQPKALERGSGNVSLKDIYRLDEIVQESSKGLVDVDDDGSKKI